MDKFPNTEAGPYYIFIRKKENISDSKLLDKLGLNHYKLKGNKSELRDEIYDLGPTILITECQDWIHIIDSWYYDMWHSLIQNLKYLKNLAKEYEIFTCMVGDSCESVNFHYYKKGKLVRKYIYDEHNGKVLKEEYFGNPLPSEYQPNEPVKHLNYVLNIAQSIGVNLEHAEDEIRCYVNTSPQHDLLE